MNIGVEFLKLMQMNGQVSSKSQPTVLSKVCLEQICIHTFVRGQTILPEEKPGESDSGACRGVCCCLQRLRA